MGGSRDGRARVFDITKGLEDHLGVAGGSRAEKQHVELFFSCKVMLADTLAKDPRPCQDHGKETKSEPQSQAMYLSLHFLVATFT